MVSYCTVLYHTVMSNTMWSRGKGASRNFLPGFPLGQSMTYRLPVAANQAPGTAYTTTSQPSDGPLGVGLLAPGQSQQRLKKKKRPSKGDRAL